MNINNPNIVYFKGIKYDFDEIKNNKIIEETLLDIMNRDMKYQIQKVCEQLEKEYYRYK